MNSLLYNIEDALTNLATSSSFSSSFHIYTGIDDESKQAPCIICKAVSAEQIYQYSNVYRVGVVVSVKQIPTDDNLADMDFNFQAMFRDIMNASESLGRYADNLAVYQVLPTGLSKTISGDAVSQDISVELVACLKQ